jgi:hypothetical protein
VDRRIDGAGSGGQGHSGLTYSIRKDGVMHWLLILLLLIVTGCERNKTTGPKSVLPEFGTTLYFAQCDPTITSELGGLNPDGTQACQSDIALYGGEYVWRSNSFYNLSGSVAEGYRLLLQRDVQFSHDTTIVWVDYEGVANHFQRSLQLLPGETTSSFEVSETADVPSSADSGITAAIHVSGSNVRLNADPGSGSLVIVGVDRSRLCEFAIYQGFNGGEGERNGAVNFSYLNAGQSVDAHLFLDFTGGASVNNQLFYLGPRYGIAYLAASSGLCRDTAVFYAPPPALQFRVDTLEGTASTLTDGQQMWPYSVDYPNDAGACARVRIYYPGGSLMLDQTYPSCSPIGLTYDQKFHLIWVIQRDDVAPDTAWGYTTNGILDSTVVAETIPNGDLVRGQWVASSLDGYYVRHVYFSPFEGGAVISQIDVPGVITQDYHGLAGVAPAGATSFNEWTVNVFDSSGNWIARYPILGNPNYYQTSFQVAAANIIAADSVIVYQAFFVYDDLTYLSETRALKP